MTEGLISSKEASSFFIKLQEKGQLDSMNHAIAQCESFPKQCQFWKKTFLNVRGTCQR
jgi:hypothetical protein